MATMDKAHRPHHMVGAFPSDSDPSGTTEEAQVEHQLVHAVVQQNPELDQGEDAESAQYQLLQAQAEANSSQDGQDRLDWQKWFAVAQQSLGAANSAQSAGFAIAKGATSASLAVARFFTKHALSLPALAVDTIAGSDPSSPGVRTATQAGVDGLFNIIDTVALGSLDLGSGVTGVALSAASTGMDGFFSTLDNDVLRSLATFGKLVSREWNTTSEDLPPGGIPLYNRLTVARALLAWICIQTLTREDYEAEIFKHLRRVSVDGEQSSNDQLPLAYHERSVTSPEAKQLAQYSRLILAIYGGAIMALLGSVPSHLISNGSSGTSNGGRPNEDLLLLDIAASDPQHVAEQPNSSVSTDKLIATTSSEGPAQPFSYVNLLAGTYDHFLLHDAAGVPSTSATVGSYANNIPESLDQEGPKNTSRPGYYVIVSEESKKVIVVMRGTITLGDVATDLTCESQCVDDLFNDVPKGSVVHSGMLVTALAIGRPGQAVHRAVQQALLKHPDYDLDLVGHSLGAGVVGLLSLIWASPLTGKTRSSSGFGDHKVHAYCYAVPCLMDAKLGEHCTSIITSFVSSWDLVSRLSLGSITDIRNALAWLCYWENTPEEDFNCGTFIRTTLEHQTGRLDDSVSGKSRFEESAKALARRIDEHMHGVHLYPPGKIYLSYQDHEVRRNLDQPTALYEVNGDRKAVFDRILFAAGMLGGHLPQVYVRILTSLDSAESI